MNPYQTLGVSSAASQDEIKNAYRNLAKKFHPDLNPGNREAEKKFKEINAAYELLRTVEARAKFDQGKADEATSSSSSAWRHQGPRFHETQRDGGRYAQDFSGFDRAFFESLFGQRSGRRNAAEEMPGDDLEFKMEIDFRDAVLGARREVGLPNGKRLQVTIPPGVDSGQRLRFRGQGDPGTGSGGAGDLYVEILVRPSAAFRRKGLDLESDLAISLPEAVLGGEVRVPTVDGSILMRIPKGVSSGVRLRIRGKGIRTQVGAGDQYVVLQIILPEKIDPELEAVISRWSVNHPYHPRSGASDGKKTAV